MKTLFFILLALPLSLFAQKSTTVKSKQKSSATTVKPKQKSSVQTPETLRHELILLNSKKEKSSAELLKIKSKWDASTKRMVEVRDKATATSKKLDAMNAKPSSSKKEKERLETQFNNELVLLDKLVGDSNTFEAQHKKKAAEVKRLSTRIDKVQKQLAVVEAKDKKLATNKK